MKKLFSLLLAAAMVLTLAACGVTNADSNTADEPKNNAAADAADPAPTEETPESTGSKVLVAYFSATGHTKTIAEYLQAALDADLYEIVPQEPYTDPDLDYNTDGYRANQEQNDDAARPAIAGQVADMVQYDTVFVGFPIWWYQAPRIIETFLESYDFSGKTVIPFATSGGSGMGKTNEKLAPSCPGAKLLHGKVFNSYSSKADLSAWIETLSL